MGVNEVVQIGRANPIDMPYQSPRSHSSAENKGSTLVSERLRVERNCREVLPARTLHSHPPRGVVEEFGFILKYFWRERSRSQDLASWCNWKYRGEEVQVPPSQVVPVLPRALLQDPGPFRYSQTPGSQASNNWRPLTLQLLIRQNWVSQSLPRGLDSRPQDCPPKEYFIREDPRLLQAHTQQRGEPGYEFRTLLE